MPQEAALSDLALAPLAVGLLGGLAFFLFGMDRLTEALDPSFPGELQLPREIELERRILEDVRTIFAGDLVSRVRRKLRAVMARDPRQL